MARRPRGLPSIVTAPAAAPRAAYSQSARAAAGSTRRRSQRELGADERRCPRAGRRGGTVEVPDEHGGRARLQLDLGRQLGVVLEAPGRRDGWPRAGAIQSWIPCEVARGSLPVRSSAWETPCPAVMRLSCPGRIGCSEPRLSRWSDLALRRATSRSAGRCAGAGPMSTPCSSVTATGPHVVREAPRPDRAATSARQGPADRQRPHLGRPARRVTTTDTQPLTIRWVPRRPTRPR